MDRKSLFGMTGTFVSKIVCRVNGKSCVECRFHKRRTNMFMLRKNEPFVWGEVQQTSFQKLKELVAQASTLAYFRRHCNTPIIAAVGP